MVRSTPFVRPALRRRLRAAILPSATRATLLATLLLGACEQPRVSWADAQPERTMMPSPLAHPPFTPYDSTLAADSPLADFLVTQDRLREAGAASMLDSAAAMMTEAADPLTTTKSVATVAAGPAPAPDTAAMAGMDHSQHTMAAPAMPATLGAGEQPNDPARCARSLRLVRAPGFGTLAVWWTRASAGRVHLMAAWQDSTATSATGAWRGPIPIDTLDQGAGDAQAADRGSHGCARPAPSVVWDARTAFAHVAYAVRGPEGPGVFYAHQMDPRAAFESPVAVLYGELLGTVRVAADGDVVAVAYEDPNTRGRTRVGLAVSRTAGHTFEEQRFIASDDASEASDPHVRVKGRAVVVGWSDVAKSSVEPPFVIRRLRVLR